MGGSQVSVRCLILRRPCELNGNTDHGAKRTLASQWLTGRTGDRLALAGATGVAWPGVRGAVDWLV